MYLQHIWRTTPDPGITWKTCSLREEPHTDPHPKLRKIIPTLSWHTPTLSLRVPCTKHPHRTRNERVGIIFLSVGWGSVWGSSRRLQVFYVIPGSGVVRHMLGGNYSSLSLVYTWHTVTGSTMVVQWDRYPDVGGSIPLSYNFSSTFKLGGCLS